MFITVSMQDARWEADELLTVLPDTTIANVRARHPFRRAEDLKRLIDDLRAAGIPE